MRPLRILALVAACGAALLFGRDATRWRAHAREAEASLRRAHEEVRTERESLEQVTRSLGTLEEERARERHASFRASLAGAVEALEGLRLPEVEALLDAVPEEHVGWEWSHLARRLELATREVFDAPSDIARLAVSADGERLALATHDGELFTLATRDWSVTAELPTEHEPVEWSALAVEGESLLAVSEEGHARLSRGGELVRWSEREEGYTACALQLAAPEPLAVLGLAGGRVLLEPASSTPGAGERLLDEHGEDVGALAFSRDGRWIASACDDGAVRVHTGADFGTTRELGNHGDWVRALAFDAGAERLASGDDAGRVVVWDLGSGERVAELDPGWGAIRDLAFLGQGLSCTTEQGRGRLTEGYALREFELADLGWQESVACLYEREGRSWLVYAEGSTLRLVGSSVPPAAVRQEVAGSEITAVGQDPAGERIVATSLGGGVHALDATSGELLWEREVYGAALCVAFDAAGTRVAVGTRSGEVLAWDLADGRELARWRGGQAIADLALSEEGRRVTWTGWGGAAGLADLEAAEEDSELAWRDAPPMLVLGVAVRDGLQVWAGDGGTLRAWRLASGERVAALRERSLGRVEALALGAGARRLVAVAGGTRLTVVDLEASRTLAQADEPGRAVRALALDPEGERFLAGGHAGRVTVHEAASAEVLVRLEGPRDSVGCVAFSPDGERALAGTSSGEVWIWPADPTDTVLEERP